MDTKKGSSDLVEVASDAQQVQRFAHTEKPNVVVHESSQHEQKAGLVEVSPS